VVEAVVAAGSSWVDAALETKKNETLPEKLTELEKQGLFGD